MDKPHSDIESPSGKQSFLILKWLLIIVLAATAFLGGAIATNANRRERLRQFFSGEPMQWEISDDSADR